MPEEMKPIAFAMNEEMMNQVNEIASKKKRLIDKMIQTNVPGWKQIVMKKAQSIGKFFNYGIKSELKHPEPGEMLREEIYLMQGNDKLDQATFIVKEGEGPDLRGIIPGIQEANKEKPNYIG